jgi:hypothetical protein
MLVFPTFSDTLRLSESFIIMLTFLTKEKHHFPYLSTPKLLSMCLKTRLVFSSPVRKYHEDMDEWADRLGTVNV